MSLLSIGGQVEQAPKPSETGFDLYRNQIIVQAMIDGKGPFHMLLDTGTDPSAIDLATARELGLKLPSRGGPVAGGGTTPNTGYETRIPILTLGSLTVRNISAVALDLSKLSEQLAKPISGVLGQSLLNGRTVLIDYPGRVVRFYDRALLENAVRAPATANRMVLRFRYDGKILIDDSFVNGRKVTASLDTGSNEAFQLTPAAVASLALQEEAKNGRRAPSVGYNGVSENTQGQVKSIKIGSLNLDSPTVTFFPMHAGHDNEPWELNVGNGFLKDFVLTIDYRSHVLTLNKPQ